VSDEKRPFEALYPFLHERKQDPEVLDRSLLESVRQKADHSVEVKRRFFEQNGEQVVQVSRAVADVYRQGGRMYSMGNGGSSCDAAHFAVEFLHPITAGRPALTATNLVNDDAMMTAVGNDVGFDHIFVRQVIALGRPGDGLVGFSTSGNSRNLLRAYAKAKEIGMTTIGMAGASGGEMAASPDVDHCLVVDTDSIHRIQETHVASYHIIWDLVHTLLADERGGLRATAEE
jgi:D-sedoheptulose 7-phosphate isomerase